VINTVALSSERVLDIPCRNKSELADRLSIVAKVIFIAKFNRAATLIVTGGMKDGEADGEADADADENGEVTFKSEREGRSRKRHTRRGKTHI
jgi:hypothetical protein